MGRKFTAEVRENLLLNKNHCLLTFVPPASAEEPQPGQFYMIGVSGLYDPLLKRPFSLLRLTEAGHQILYRVKGKGTQLMKELGAGALLDVVGPLGCPFPMPGEGEVPVVVAGGVGIAPMFHLIERMPAKPLVLYGARTRDDLLLLDDLKLLAGELRLSTDDGSMGKRGTVLTLLAGLCAEERTVLYVCGQKAMARAVAEFAAERKLKGYVCLEEHMACGLGACLGCAVKTTEGYRMACKEGPVFKMEEIIW